MEPIHEGLYDHLLSIGLKQALELRGVGIKTELSELSEAATPARLARLLGAEIYRVLRSAGDVQGQVDLANRLLRWLWEQSGIPRDEKLEVAFPAELLRAIYKDFPPPRPDTSLAESTLLSRPGQPELGRELAREIASSDKVDAIISFVTRDGFRRLKGALESNARAQRPFRLLTTTYTGATEADAIREIVALPGAEVRISYDGRRSRLHAKAWLFHRLTGCNTAYIGSANLSASALATGLEWMMKATQADLPHVIGIFRGAFDSLWNDPEFEPFDSQRDGPRLEKALQAAKGGRGHVSSLPMLFFDLRPHPFQQKILNDLDDQRKYFGHRRNLIVAATGTGKTLIAAFDYARQPDRPRLIFLAHRFEILQQAMTTFRQVLKDQSFGALLAAGIKPERHDFLFATVQSFLSSGLMERLGADFWKFAVVDECHHLPAPSYRAMIERLRPALLLGLTATPERSDGADILPDFDNRVSAEIRLWQAIEKQLIAPFEYYGISDGVDLSDIRWTRGNYAIQDLEAVYTGNDRRAELVASQFERLRGNLQSARALGFCVSIAHAEFMAQKFNQFGIPALAVHGNSPESVRGQAPGKLQAREVNILFTCDLFNEGVDLPFVDTLLFLRPTSSPTVYIQQLGRGLRIDKEKNTCLVLDFIGQHRQEFRMDRLLQAMTGIPRGKLSRAVEQDFPCLPAGCHMQLDRVARERILQNLRLITRSGPATLARELRDSGDLPLAEFLEHTGRSLEELYNAGGMTTLRRKAGFLPPGDGSEESINDGFIRLIHIDELARLDAMENVQGADRLRLQMLAYQLFWKTGDLGTSDQLLGRLTPELRRELVELAGILRKSSHPRPSPAIDPFPLALHRTYSRREIQTATGHWTPQEKPQSREGVLRLKSLKTELLFVTLDKSGGSFSSTTSYEDYAVSRSEFHWQSQSTTSDSSEAGSRYMGQESNGWRFLLFVRPTVDDEYLSLGPVRYLSHSGSRPMSILWRLDFELPPEVFERYATLLAA